MNMHHDTRLMLLYRVLTTDLKLFDNPEKAALFVRNSCYPEYKKFLEDNPRVGSYRIIDTMVDFGKINREELITAYEHYSFDNDVLFDNAKPKEEKVERGNHRGIAWHESVISEWQNSFSRQSIEAEMRRYSRMQQERARVDVQRWSQYIDAQTRSQVGSVQEYLEARRREQAQANAENRQRTSPNRRYRGIIDFV